MFFFHPEWYSETLSQEEKIIGQSRFQPQGWVTMGMRLGIKYGIAPPSNCLQNLLENGFVNRVDVRS